MTFLPRLLTAAVSLLIVIGPTGCGGPRLVHDEWAPGKPKRHGTVIDYKQEGLWEYWYDNGAKESAGNWVHDKQDGEWTWWYPDGRIKQTGSYQGTGIDLSNRSSSPRTGMWRYWHPNGQLESMGAYDDDRQTGPWSYFTADGTPFASGSFKRGVKDGSWTIWHTNGKIKEVGNYNEGIKAGLWSYWNEKGELAEKITYTVDGAVVSNEPVKPVMVKAPPVVPPPTPEEKINVVPPVTEIKPLETTAPAADDKIAIVKKPATEEIVIPEKDAIPLSPNASVPNLWTTEQEAVAGDLIKAYTTGALHRLRGYKNEKFSDTKDRQRKDLIGKKLSQTRYIDATGSVLDIEELCEKGPVLMVILRGFSGQVCLYCAAQTTALSDSIERFKKAGIQVVVVYPGPVDAIPSFINAVRSLRKDPPAMPVCLDASLLGVRSLKLEGSLAIPSSLIIDSKGIIQYAYQGKTIADRPPVEELLFFANSIIAKGAQ